MLLEKVKIVQDPLDGAMYLSGYNQPADEIGVGEKRTGRLHYKRGIFWFFIF